jgi:hypothetical protein
LQQGQTKFAFGGDDFLSLWRELRNPAIAWIDDPGRAHAAVLPGDEEVVAGAGDVELGPALLAIVLAAQRRALGIQFGSLRVGEKFLACIFGGALQGRVGFVQPNALQIGVAPRRLRRRGWCRG